MAAMSPLHSLILFCLTTALTAAELDGVRAPAAGPCPTVEEAIKKMTVPEGYEVRNFAAEPMVINPVAMTWDARGRLWVVELYEYPLGAKNPNDYSKTATDEDWHPVIKTGEGSPRDRVIVLEDTDNDGVADKRTVFVEGLSLATAILCGHGGVFVGQVPNMFFFRDTDGDDKADEYKTVLTGFGMEDRHELLNSFTWGPDGWMYFTHGVFTNSKVHRPTVPKEEGNTLNAGIYRVKFENKSTPSTKSPPAGTKLTGVTAETGPTATRHEVFADGTSNPWGCDYDAAGNWFVEACVIDHLFHMAPGGIYQRQGGAPENPYAYELLPSIVNHKHFRAAYAGIQVYQGGRYPADTNGHLFFGNIHDNAIHEEAVEPVGATFKAKPIRDFLRANDGWFRPVSIQTGPDGFLWVMDWCDKYPCYQNAQANPEGVDREKGRIWRICYTGDTSRSGGVPPPLLGSRPEKDMDLQKKTTNELAPLIADSNSWMRRTARRALGEHSDIQLALKAVVTNAKEHPAEATIDSNWLTDGLLGRLRVESATGVGNFSIFSFLKNDTDPVVRTWAALQLADREDAWGELRRVILPDAPPSPAQCGLRCLPFLENLAKDASSSVQFAVAYAARKLALSRRSHPEADTTQPSVWSITKKLILTAHNAPDKTLELIIWLAMEPDLAQTPSPVLTEFATLAPTTKPLSETLTYKSARRITDTRSAENMDLLLAFLDQIKSDDTLVAKALEGMLKAQEAGAVKPAKTDPAPFFAAWAKSANAAVRDQAARLATLWGDPNAVAALMGLVLDPKADEAKRISAIQTVRKLKSAQARAGILTLLGTKTSDALTLEILRAAGELGGMDLANAVLKAWSTYSPALKSAATEVLISRSDWAAKLLDAVEGKWLASQQISPTEIPATARRYYATQGDAAAKERALKLLGAWNESNADTKAVIAAKRKAVLTGEPNLTTGKLLFTATCATCHKFHGGGQEVGPELIGSGRSSLDALLNNVVDPNQIIGNGYENTIVNTKDNRTLAGRVVEDTPTQVTLLGIGGRREVIARGDISKQENTHQSVMPSGFGGLPDEALRDLLWYVLAPPEEGPLTPEKKAALAEPVTSVTPVTDVTKAKTAAIDWESVRLWQPAWTVEAPEFEGTPLKLTHFMGRKNVLQMHPFPDKKTPARLVQKVSVNAEKPQTLHFSVASKADYDWELIVRVNGQEVKKETIGPKPERWHVQEISLEKWRGQTVEVSLENHANGWAWEFSYWEGLGW